MACIKVAGLSQLASRVACSNSSVRTLLCQRERQAPRACARNIAAARTASCRAVDNSPSARCSVLTAVSVSPGDRGLADTFSFAALAASCSSRPSSSRPSLAQPWCGMAPAFPTDAPLHGPPKSACGSLSCKHPCRNLQTHQSPTDPPRHLYTTHEIFHSGRFRTSPTFLYTAVLVQVCL